MTSFVNIVIFGRRGVAEDIRYMLAMAKVPYEDKRFSFSFGVPGDFSTIKRPERVGRVPSLRGGQRVGRTVEGTVRLGHARRNASNRLGQPALWPWQGQRVPELGAARLERHPRRRFDAAKEAGELDAGIDGRVQTSAA